ncbi:MAG: YmfQ family protein [Actinomycetota bacterium]|nr:YmfQ family protein [Actinomycetota bacterium]
MPTLLLLNFDAPAATLLPRDAMGNLGPLAPVPGVTTMPSVADSYTGKGRQFLTPDTGLLAVDAAGRDTLANQDVTVQVLLSFGAAGALPVTIYQRGGMGVGGTSARLRVEAVGPAYHYMVTLYTESTTGSISPGAGASFYFDGYGSIDRFVLLTATRRHEVDRTVYRYYLGADLLGEVETVSGVDGAPGSAGGATTAQTAIGGAFDGATWSEYFDGVIDQLKVTDYEMSHEEVRATWERITVHQPAAVAALAALTPPGLGWGADPSSRIGKLVRVAGEGLGMALAKSDEFRQNFLPDRAYSETLERWESLIGLSSGAADSLGTRRQRVSAFLARDNGFSAAQIKIALVELFDLDVASIEILKFANRWTDNFATLEAERWHHESPLVWSIVAGELVMTVPIASDSRWNGSQLNPFRCITPLSSGKGRIVVAAKVDAYSLPLNTIAGLHLFNWRSNNALWFGLQDVAGVDTLGYVSYVAGVRSAFTAILSPAPAAPLWLRIIRNPTPAAILAIELGAEDTTHTYVLGYSTTGPDSGFTETDVASLLPDPEWAGFGASSTAAALAADASATFDDFVCVTPFGTRPFTWYAYRDPGLGGSPDMTGANLLLWKLRPAHTHAAAIASLSLLCDDLDDGGCDRGPMGGI